MSFNLVVPVTSVVGPIDGLTVSAYVVSRFANGDVPAHGTAAPSGAPDATGVTGINGNPGQAVLVVPDNNIYNICVTYNGTTWWSQSTAQGPQFVAYFGTFYDTSTQTLANTTTAYAIKINTDAEPGHGVSIANDGSGNPTKIVFTNAGTYNVQFSVQLSNSSTSIQNATIWLRKGSDGGASSDVTNSAGTVAVPNSHGGANGYIIACWNYVLTLAANDYLQLVWHADSTGVTMPTLPAGTNPTTPASPSVILTAQQVR